MDGHMPPGDTIKTRQSDAGRRSTRDVWMTSVTPTIQERLVDQGLDWAVGGVGTRPMKALISC